jgi:hypothetical protein
MKRGLLIVLAGYSLGMGAVCAAEGQPYLEERVQTLEKQVRELSERLNQLEQRPAAAEPKPAYAVPLEEANAPKAEKPPGWQSADAWNKLRRGMTQIQVTQLLGNPVKRSGDRYTERWHYPDDSAWVEFDQVGDVSRWQAPGVE